jgi:hypothetical protein
MPLASELVDVAMLPLPMRKDCGPEMAWPYPRDPGCARASSSSCSA